MFLSVWSFLKSEDVSELLKQAMPLFLSVLCCIHLLLSSAVIFICHTTCCHDYGMPVDHSWPAAINIKKIIYKKFGIRPKKSISHIHRMKGNPIMHHYRYWGTLPFLCEVGRRINPFIASIFWQAVKLGD